MHGVFIRTTQLLKGNTRWGNFDKVKLFRVIHRTMSAESNVSVSRSGKLLVPEAVRGMRELNPELFRTDVGLPAISVRVKDLTNIRGKVRIEKYLLKNLHGVKNVMDTEVSSRKLLIFDPEIVGHENHELKQEIIGKIREVVPAETDLSWSTVERTISYDNWDMRRILRAVLPKELDFSSFTQTGHIVHCNFRDELIPYKKVIGQILLSKVKQCKTVVNKLDGISSTFRNFDLELVAGEEDYVAEVVEAGVRYRLDFSKVFWNSRLSHEHERVFSKFNTTTHVYDACAGVGPFVIPAIKKYGCRRVLANDLNPESVRWLQENIKLNKIPSSAIETFNTDAVKFIRGAAADDLAKEITRCTSCPDWTVSSGAHFIMNLPAYSVNFLPAFRGMLSENFADQEVPEQRPFPITAYCYLFAKAHEDVADGWYEEKAREMVNEKLPGAKVLLAHHVRTVSSRKEMFCIQIDLTWDLLFAKEETKEPAAKRCKNE